MTQFVCKYVWLGFFYYLMSVRNTTGRAIIHYRYNYIEWIAFVSDLWKICCKKFSNKLSFFFKYFFNGYTILCVWVYSRGEHDVDRSPPVDHQSFFKLNKRSQTNGVPFFWKQLYVVDHTDLINIFFTSFSV